MKFPSLKLRKKSSLSLQPLRPAIFDIDRAWLILLGFSLLIFITTTFIGLKLFYSEYFESYKQKKPSESSSKIIDINKLEKAIEKRADSVSQEFSPHRDPSL